MEEQFTGRGEGEDVNGAVFEGAGMDFGSGGLADHLILVIDYVEDFVSRLRGIVQGMGVGESGEIDPLGHAQFFGAS